MHSSDLLPGTTVIAQDGSGRRGTIADQPHPLDGFVWVEWEHIGRWDECVEDVDIAA